MVKKWYVSLFFLVVLLGVTCMKTTNVDVSASNRFPVQLGEELELRKGQRAGLIGSGFEIGILNFFNRPCPPGVKCVWSGVGIEFEYRNDGQVRRGINLVRAFGYRTIILRSDYESYAILKITKDGDE